MVVVLAGLVLGVLVMVHVASCVGVGLRVWSARRRTPGAAPPAVTILRPVCGLENHLEETLRTSFRLSASWHETIFCAPREDDPAVPVVRRLIARHPDADARLLVGEERVGAGRNPKLDNLAKGWRAARHDVVVMADSNVRLPRDCLERLWSAWGPDTGLVSAPAIGADPDGAWAELECAFLNTYQARWLLAADSLGLAYAQGKIMTMRRSDIERAGGYGVLARDIAEDSAATKAIRALGKSVKLATFTLPQPLGRRTLGVVWVRQVRWARLRRAAFPVPFALEILSGPLAPFALACGLALSGALHPGWLAALALVWYGAEAWLAILARWRMGLFAPAFWILRDLLLPWLWISGWAASGYHWRGTRVDV